VDGRPTKPIWTPVSVSPGNKIIGVNDNGLGGIPLRRHVRLDPNFSIVTYAELMYGVEHSRSTRINRPIIKGFVKHLDVLQWDVAAADQCVVIRTKLEAKGSPIGAMDMMIAANAISHELPY